MTRLPIILIAALLIAGCSRISRNPDLMRADELTLPAQTTEESHGKGHRIIAD